MLSFHYGVEEAALGRQARRVEVGCAPGWPEDVRERLAGERGVGRKREGGWDIAFEVGALGGSVVDAGGRLC